MKLLRLFVVAIALAAPPAQAHFVNGNTLKEWCDAGQLYCSAYVMATIDSYEVRGSKYCPPVDTIAQQVIDATKQYLTDNPQERLQNASLLIGKAMIKSWRQCEIIPADSAPSKPKR